jgi:uncharacterized spore protein YtfJ
MTQVDEVMAKLRESIDIRVVFGEPYERDGLTILPVARVIGGGGGGAGAEGDGSGGGFGFVAEPVGVYVVSDGRVRWEPAVNVNRIVVGGIAVAIVAVLTVPRMLKQIRKMQRGR